MNKPVDAASSVDSGDRTVEVPPSDPPRADWTRSVAEKRLGLAWVLTFALGVLVIIRTPSGETRRVVLPVLFLVAYAIYGVVYKRKNTPKFADSLYFMGFLWTLVALIHTLLQGQLELARVLVTFGYALVTTAAGMFLRLLLLEFHETLPEQLADAENEIDREVAALSEQLRNARVEISSFRGSLKKHLEGELGQLTEVMSAVNIGIRTAQASAAQAAADEFAKALGALRARFEESAASYDALRAHAADTLGSLGQSGRQLEHATSSLSGQILAVSRRLEEALHSVQEPFTRINQVSERFPAELQETFRRLTSKVEAGGQQIQESLADLALSVGGAPVRADLDRLAVNLQRLAAESNSSAAAFEAMRTQLADLGTKLGESYAGLERMPEGLARVDAHVAAIGGQALASLSTRLTEAETAVQEARQAGAELHRAVVEVLEFIRRELGKAPITP